MFGYQLRLIDKFATRDTGNVNAWTFTSSASALDLEFDIVHLAPNGLVVGSSVVLYNVPPDILFRPELFNGWQIELKAGMLASGFTRQYYPNKKFPNNVNELDVIILGYVWQAIVNIDYKDNSIAFSVFSFPPTVRFANESDKEFFNNTIYKLEAKKHNLRKLYEEAFRFLARDLLSFEQNPFSEGVMEQTGGYVRFNSTIVFRSAKDLEDPVTGLEQLIQYMEQTFGIKTLLIGNSKVKLCTISEYNNGTKDSNGILSATERSLVTSNAKQISNLELIGQPTFNDMKTLRATVDLNGGYKLGDYIIINDDASSFVNLNSLVSVRYPSAVTFEQPIDENAIESPKRHFAHTFTPVYAQGRYFLRQTGHRGHFRKGIWQTDLTLIKLEDY